MHGNNLELRRFINLILPVALFLTIVITPRDFAISHSSNGNFQVVVKSITWEPEDITVGTSCIIRITLKCSGEARYVETRFYVVKYSLDGLSKPTRISTLVTPIINGIARINVSWKPMFPGFYRLIFSTNLSVSIRQTIFVNNGYKTFRFIVCGDCRPARPNDPIPETFKKLINVVNLIRPDFLIIAGDLIYGYHATGRNLERQYLEFDKCINACIVPVITAVGNHDTKTGRRHGSGDPYAEQLYIRLYGRLYYSFNVGNTHIIILDTDVVGSAVEIKGTEQGLWLENDLKQHGSCNPIFVIMHRPVVGSPSGWSREDIEYLTNLFTKHRVNAVFQGHIHLYRNISYRGVTYYITGGAGAPLGGKPINGGIHHFLLVEVNGSSFKVKFYPIDVIRVHYYPANNGRHYVVSASVSLLFATPIKVSGKYVRPEPLRLDGVRFIMPIAIGYVVEGGRIVKVIRRQMYCIVYVSALVNPGSTRNIRIIAVREPEI